MRNVRADRVLSAGAFREIGRPRVTAICAERALIAVGGAHTHRQWHGRDVSSRARNVGRRPRLGWYPTAVYRTGDLHCLLHVTTVWPANALAFHPTLPLLAIGTGSYDGGYRYEGELLLLNLATGDSVSLLADPREIRGITWRDPHTLDLALAIACDDDEEHFGTTTVTCSLRRDDWQQATAGMLRPPFDEQPLPDHEPADPVAAAAVLEELSATWTPRGAVWAVQTLTDGRILAAAEDGDVQCWTPGSDIPVWRTPTGGGAYQLLTLPGEQQALVLAQPRGEYSNGWWRTPPGAVLDVDLGDGTVRATHRTDVPAVLVGRSDGRWALRDTDHTATGTKAGQVRLHPTTVQLGGYDLFNHHFDIRYAPDLLFLQGRPGKPSKDKAVVAVDTPGGPVRRLFALEWDTTRGGHLFGGCGAYVDDRNGPAIVYSGTVHDGRGLLPGNAFVVRRAYPSGEPQWVFTADAEATSVDVDTENVYVAYNNGELVILRAADGTVRARQLLHAGGHPVVPLTLARHGADRLTIGTLDGRVLDCVIG